MYTQIYMENRTKERGSRILRYTWRIELRREVHVYSDIHGE